MPDLQSLSIFSSCFAFLLVLLCFFIVYQLKAFEKHFLKASANFFENFFTGAKIRAIKPVKRAKTGSITGLRSAIYAAKPAAAAQNMNM